MTIRSLFAATVLAASVTLTMAPAHAAAPMNKRLKTQRHRIHQGVKKGTLTPMEARRMRRQEAALTMRTAHAEKTGEGITPGERRRLQRSASRESRRIYRQKHDTQNR